MKKDFDCVEMKRRIQAEIYAEIKDLSDEQRAEHTRRAVERGPLAAVWNRLRTREELARERPKRRDGV